LLFTLNAFGNYTDSFIVKVGEHRISVSAPKKKAEVVSIIIENLTLDKIISELKTKEKVLKRFVLKPQGKEVIQVDYSKIKKLYYVPIAPPFEAVELKFGKKYYEIPPKE